MRGHERLVDLFRGELAGRYVGSDETGGAGELGARAVVHGEGEHHAGVVGRLGQTLLEDLAGLLG